MNLAEIKKAYFIGIKGVGMTALAEIFASHKILVTGSDTEEKFITDEVLKRLGISYFEGFSENHITTGIDLVVVSTGHMEQNKELAKARQLNLPILTYPEALALVFNDKYGIAICGTHGKTTTAAMIGEILADGGLDPTALVGSKVLAWQTNAKIGKSKYFVAEVDEYQNKLKYYSPQIAILTNIELDHPDFFSNLREYKKVFEDFVEKIPIEGLLIVNYDDKNAMAVAKKAYCQVISYGKSSQADFYYEKLRPNKNKQKFRVYFKRKRFAEFSLPLPGEFNILNSLAAIVLTNYLKIKVLDTQRTISDFTGTARRLERRGLYNEAVIIDDYAHHPTEIKVSLEALRQFYPDKKIYCVFHPHTYSRTKALLKDFARSFGEADQVIVLDIYSSAREKGGTIHSRDLVREIKKFHDNVLYLATIEEVTEYLKKKLKKGDLVVTMGAGDVWKVGEKLLGKK